MIEQIVRGPLLIPSGDGKVAFHPDGALAADRNGILEFAGDWSELKQQLPASPPPVRLSDGTMLPPLLDIHTHISQHPIRGRFVEGVPENAPGGRLLAGLKRNVYPAETRCHDRAHAEQIIADFRNDALAAGVVGGAAYMTVSASAAEAALAALPETWSVGMVLMNQNCPGDLRTDEANLERDMTRLAERFGRRCIVTDRFAVAVTSPLRKRAVKFADRFGLRTQTHLNEQIGEKQWIEKELYPQAESYTAVYRDDGLLNHQCILAHCIQMTASEWPILVQSGSVIAHCPTSNLLLGSGIMSLDRVIEHKIPYAIATDVGASPTVSMLAEMGRFLQVHTGRSVWATPAEALFRATLAPALVLGLDEKLGQMEPGRPMSFIEVRSRNSGVAATADEAIRGLIPGNLDNPESSVTRVTLMGKPVYELRDRHA
jgi:guanine deaminase